ncbi:NlpC/P60 family protein [Bacillus sp. 31A1R]|uniref:NlpC/P60 family protein n=1 Tax=Robertmurraya mangrovi TaxID=3098077 RepID=A0ABU5J0Q9_9BACI|nr:NlpC/P60 family protein [Bacillus sp. 31A1R]MDZ5472992.1 NlpC/P60 family protein [Bacillus sp. 31A1R]
MKKGLVTTSLALALTFSSVAIPSIPAFNVTEASAATVVNPYNNQTAVNAKADQLIQTAKSLIGQATYSNTEYKPTYPYKFSCATFLMYIFEKNGVDLATYNENYMLEQGVYVPRDQLQKGDLVFFDANKTNTDPSDHVAMYIGDNKVIHMADPQQNIVISDMSSKPYYTTNYVTARRVLPSLLAANPATKGDKIVDSSYELMKKAVIGSTNNPSTNQFTRNGYINHVYQTNGVTLGTTSTTELMKKGTTVSKTNLKKGDLVFFSSTIGSTTPSLVGIYAGDHRIIVPSTGKVLTRVLFVDYYKQRFITAKRVFTESTTTTTTTQPTTTTQATTQDKIASFATNLTGKAKFGYTYNESTLTFTGAGFTYYVFKQYGIDLKTKMASAQSSIGTAVSKANLKKGDLVYFSTNNLGTTITHAGVYVGDNKVVHLSPTTKGVVTEDLSSTWAQKNYVTARRAL